MYNKNVKGALNGQLRTMVYVLFEAIAYSFQILRRKAAIIRRL